MDGDSLSPPLSALTALLAKSLGIVRVPSGSLYINPWIWEVASPLERKFLCCDDSEEGAGETEEMGERCLRRGDSDEALRSCGVNIAEDNRGDEGADVAGGAKGWGGESTVVYKFALRCRGEE